VTAGAQRVLWALQATVLALPLFLGGRQPLALTAAWIVVTALLWATLRARRHAGRPHVPGAWWLAAFVALGLVTSLPLPPWLIERLAPATAALYRDVLPGWPDGGGWAVWRSLAWDPYAVWTRLGRLAVGLGAYVVLAGYPWGDDAARARVFGRMLLTALAGGVFLAAFALVQEVLGNGSVAWLSDEPVTPGRASGPFVNPNHLALWLELLIPVGFAWAWLIAGRLWRRVRRGVESGRSLGLKARRAWVSALVANQRQLAQPFLVLAGVLVMAIAHAGTGSRGGRAALAIGLGVTLAGLLARTARHRGGRLARWLPLGVAGVAGLAGLAMLALWFGVEEAALQGDQGLEPSFAARVAVGSQGTAIVRDHPLMGTGLGSWLHAFRPYAEPPVASAIWDHAHDDYLELVAETGLVGVALVALFTLALARAIRRGRRGTLLHDARRRRQSHAGFEAPAWQLALRERSDLAWGLAGGVSAVLVHSAVDFGLHMPANFLLFMVVLGLFTLALPLRETRTSLAPFAFAVLVLAAAMPVVWNATSGPMGSLPLSPDEALERADLAQAEEGETARAQGLVLWAIDRSPANRDAHEQLADLLGSGTAGEDALRRALRLEPWYAPGRDALALRLWERGEREEAVAQLEESFARFPAFAWHAFLDPDTTAPPSSSRDLVHALALGDPRTVRLAELDPAMADAIGRGLERAMADPPAGETRPEIVADRVALLEAHERWAEAAGLLVAEAERDDVDDRSLGRAAHNYLKVGDTVRAEQALLAALGRNPERGSLYKQLAVDIYGARGDFGRAEAVLTAGERNAVDLLPVYDASVAVITKREQSWAERLAAGKESR